jgi:hypothetical protein
MARWERLLDANDSKSIWKAINWKGTFENPRSEMLKPSDNEFKCHFEKLLNPNQNSDNLYIPNTQVYMPILDDPITIEEVERAIKRQKSGKAAGWDGVPPGILKLLSSEWLVLMTLLFNVVFNNDYPLQWALSKIFVIYRKGPSRDTNNYRGISILVALAKTYDTILNHRFQQWYKPDLEQTGGQEGKGCVDQLLTLRLLIDVAQKKKFNLYIAFIDYIKAYDRVDRNV